jgi:siroheme synthase
MQSADVVLYDRLVSDDILRLVHSGARMVYVGKQVTGAPQTHRCGLPSHAVCRIELTHSRTPSRLPRLTP